MYKACEEAGYILLITADHGNAEQMLNAETGAPHTAHTTNKVPFIMTGDPEKLKFADDGEEEEEGALCDVAPTVLELLVSGFFLRGGSFCGEAKNNTDLFVIAYRDYLNRKVWNLLMDCGVVTDSSVLDFRNDWPVAPRESEVGMRGQTTEELDSKVKAQKVERNLYD